MWAMGKVWREEGRKEGEREGEREGGREGEGCPGGENCLA